MSKESHTHTRTHTFESLDGMVAVLGTRRRRDRLLAGSVACGPVSVVVLALAARRRARNFGRRRAVSGSFRPGRALQVREEEGGRDE